MVKIIKKKKYWFNWILIGFYIKLTIKTNQAP